MWFAKSIITIVEWGIYKDKRYKLYILYAQFLNGTYVGFKGFKLYYKIT